MTEFCMRHDAMSGRPNRRGTLSRVFRFLRTGGAMLLTAASLTACEHLELMNPKGDIGAQEKTLILVALGLMLLVVIPVMVLTVFFAWRYRATNTKATYAPDWAHSTKIEAIVWTIPCLIVGILAVMIWETTHSLDPYKPLDSKVPPVRVEVMALNWKWLFIYPDYGVASVNHLAIPAGTPINFTLTAESMMNSFFIPQLGTQIYAMAGMRTRLHLIADEQGTYDGLSSAFSGPGFSDMHFDVVATSPADFDKWVAQVKSSPLTLNAENYRSLEAPSIKNPAAVYANVDPGIFDSVVNRYMADRMPQTADAATSDICTAATPYPTAWNNN